MVVLKSWRCRYRTARLLQTVAARLQRHTRRLGAFHAWNKCLSHLLLLARAHIEQVTHEQFTKAANRCHDHGCRTALKCMADIFALSVRSPWDVPRLWHKRGWRHPANRCRGVSVVVHGK